MFPRFILASELQEGDLIVFYGAGFNQLAYCKLITVGEDEDAYDGHSIIRCSGILHGDGNPARIAIGRAWTFKSERKILLIERSEPK